MNLPLSQILGLGEDATDREVRKAYRKLSILYHPDKRNGDDEMFLKIAKAYEALTDEVAKENYRKFGNPDGRQALQVGVGLPNFLANRLGQYSLLLLYIGVFAVGVPLVVWFTKNEIQMPSRINLLWSIHWIKERSRQQMNMS